MEAMLHHSEVEPGEKSGARTRQDRTKVTSHHPMRCMLQMRKGEDAVKYVQKRSRDQRSMKQGRGEGSSVRRIQSLASCTRSELLMG